MDKLILKSTKVPEGRQPKGSTEWPGQQTIQRVTGGGQPGREHNADGRKGCHRGKSDGLVMNGLGYEEHFQLSLGVDCGLRSWLW